MFDPTKTWDAYKLGRMYSATHILVCEYYRRPWHGHHPESGDISSLRWHLSNRNALTQTHLVDFNAGWFDEQRAQARGQEPLELVRTFVEAE